MNKSDLAGHKINKNKHNHSSVTQQHMDID